MNVIKSLLILALTAMMLAGADAEGNGEGERLPEIAGEVKFITDINVNYNFGFCEPNRKKERRLKSQERYKRIDKIYMSYKSSVFSFQHNIKNFPVKYSDEDSLVMFLYFEPKGIGCFEDTLRILGTTFKKDTIIRYDTLITFDTLVVNGETVYSETKKIMKDISFIFDTTVYDLPILLKGCSRLDMEVWADAVKGSFMDDSVILRVTARNKEPIVDNYLQDRKYDYSFNWVINADLFYPTGIKYANIISNRMVGNKVILNIEGGGIEIDGTEKILAEISGKLLLTPVLYSPVYLSNIQWNNPWMFAIIKNGSLEADGFCFSKNSLIVFQDKEPLINVYPNPAGENAEINLNTTENGPFGIDIYNLLGRKVMSAVLPAYTGEKTDNKAYNVGFEGLSGGIYMLTVTTKYHIKTALFCIKK